ncbi:hypothetical protein [Streptomyces sp. NPDC050560]|uniref:hypothetical protein n=1 Tax=Streptomyces sp. NPDC050560 TaxID=3365630 RepID=UPI0037998A04
MSAIPIALLILTAAATAVGGASLYSVRGLRRQLSELRSELAAGTAAAPARPAVPSARPAADTDDIRTAVAEALAEEREREMAEARAFWAAQEARDASSDAHSLLGLPTDEPYLPRQTDFAGLGGLDHPGQGQEPEGAEHPEDSPELAAARRRHPSHPDFVPSAPGSDHERTVACLASLASVGTALADVRPGPLGTLDVYVFEDGTTLCMTPGHREASERLASALRRGDNPVLLGGSGIAGAYTLTFTCGDDTMYILADRVIASR